jgi:ComF family protein
LLCGAASQSGVWCAACDADLPHVITPRCPICALPSPNGQICGHCLKNPPPFDCTVAAFDYSFPINKLIQTFKYSQQLALANQLADALDHRLINLPDAIIAMPLHPLRLQARGFNQSLLLAQRIASKRDLPLLKNAVHRIRHTPPQSTLDWKARSKNLRQAFKCEEDLSGKHIAIVDDVMTSGASITELAACLRKAGAHTISAWIIARTPTN